MAVEAADASKVLREGQGLFFAEPPNHRDAAGRFEQVVALRPDWAEGHQWLGSAYEALGDEDRAAKAWQTAHEHDGADSRCLISLGVLRSRQRRFKEAIRLLERGIALNPHYRPPGRLQSGRMLIGRPGPLSLGVMRLGEGDATPRP